MIFCNSHTITAILWCSLTSNGSQQTLHNHVKITEKFSPRLAVPLLIELQCSVFRYSHQHPKLACSDSTLNAWSPVWHNTMETGSSKRDLYQESSLTSTYFVALCTNQGHKISIVLALRLWGHSQTLVSFPDLLYSTCTHKGLGMRQAKFSPLQITLLYPPSFPTFLPSVPP